MATKKRITTKKKIRPPRVIQYDVDSVIALLKRQSSKAARDSMARYGLPATHALGVPMNKLLQLAKQIGCSHPLALQLWQTGHYEARLLASMVDDPKLVTPAQMDRWVKDFDNWGVCDTVCFKLFDQTSHAMAKIKQWAVKPDEFIKRAAFALLACIALHGEQDEKDFSKCFDLIERAAKDERNFVKKAVSWAIRAMGGRSRALNVALRELSLRLANSSDVTQREIGKLGLKNLSNAALLKRLATNEGKRRTHQTM